MRSAKTWALSILIVALLSPVAAMANELIISEYIEGSSLNKAIELYNPTADPIDLSNYSIRIYSNGAASPTGTIALPAVSLVPRGTFVVANPSASFAGSADLTSGSVNFNGNDAVALALSGNNIDVIGQIGFDPGTEWGTGLTSTQDNTLRRKSALCDGDPNGADPFDPSVQWDGFATDTFGGLGAHTSACAVAPMASSWMLLLTAALLLAGGAMFVRMRFASTTA